MAGFEIDVEIDPIDAIDVEVLPIDLVDVAADPVTVVDVDASIVVAVNIDTPIVPAVDVQTAAIPAVDVSSSALQTITIDLGADVDPWAASLELGSRRGIRDARKLASSAAAFAVGNTPGTYLELPTGLIVYPSFADSGEIELKISGGFTSNGQTCTVDIKVGSAGALATVASFVSPVFTASGTPNCRWDFYCRLAPLGPNQLNIIAKMTWSHGATMLDNQYISLASGVNFQNPSVDQGDVEIRAECKTTGAGIFTIRQYLIMQYGERSGSMF